MIAGGLIYTLGALIVGFQRPDPNPEVFGYHEIWHVLVIAGQYRALRVDVEDRHRADSALTMDDALDEPLTPADLPLAYQPGRSTEGILPIAGYVIGDQIGSRLVSDDAGVRLAIVLMTAAAIWAVVQRVRRGKAIGWWIPGVAIYLFGRGIAGLIWGEDVFLAVGIGFKVALGLAALVSVLIGRALAGELAPLVLPFRRRFDSTSNTSRRCAT